VDAIAIGDGDLEARAVSQLDAGTIGGVVVHKIMCGAEVHESQAAGVVDVDVKLHRFARAWPDPDQCMDGDGVIIAVHLRCLITMVVQYFNREQMFTN
jgi:hypothetical protein